MVYSISNKLERKRERICIYVFLAAGLRPVPTDAKHVFVRGLTPGLHDTLKRKLVDFAWNRRFFYLPGACSPFSG